MYYVLRIFLTEFCTNPLCPKTVAIFLQWNGELTVPSTLYVIQIYNVLIKHKETQAKPAPVYFKGRPRTFSGNQQKVQNLFVFALRFPGWKFHKAF